MRLETKLVAFGLSASVLVSGCGIGSDAEILKVGRNAVEKVTVPIAQHYGNKAVPLNRGDECVLKRGAELILRDSVVIYKKADALGTECPDGALLDLTPDQAYAQNNSYLKFIKRRDEVTAQVANMMHVVDAKTARADGNWVDLVNPEPVERSYLHTTEMIGYGDRCLAEGTTERIGQLKTGEFVLRVINSRRQFGAECPTGAVFLEPGQ